MPLQSTLKYMQYIKKGENTLQTLVNISLELRLHGTSLLYVLLTVWVEAGMHKIAFP